MRVLKRILICVAAINLLFLLLAGCIKPSYQVSFVDQACIKPYKKYRYETCQPLAIVVHKDMHREVFKIPENFQTDLASIPRIYWSVLAPAYSSFIYPAILHDYLYSCPGDEVTRRYADDIFYSALIAQGVSQFTATIMYLGVRIFGSADFQKGNYCDLDTSFEEEKAPVISYNI